MEISEIVHSLASQLMLAVKDPSPHAGVDETGLRGRYDLDLDCSTDPDPASDASSTGARFYEAMKKELGLQVKEQKRPVQLIVLDNLTKPTGQDTN